MIVILLLKDHCKDGQEHTAVNTPLKS
jgi:hypothetical protein